MAAQAPCSAGRSRDDDERKVGANDDMLKLSSNVQCQNMLSKMGDNSPEQEKVVMSVKLVKINKRGKEHNRILLITDKALYNLKPNKIGKCLRRIDLGADMSVTISHTSQEFAIHIPEEYDYRYKSVYKERIASVLAELYKRKEGKKLFINKIQQDSMLQVTVTKDVARLQTREQKDERVWEAERAHYRQQMKARSCSDVESTHSTDEIGPFATDEEERLLYTPQGANGDGDTHGQDATMGKFDAIWESPTMQKVRIDAERMRMDEEELWRYDPEWMYAEQTVSGFWKQSEREARWKRDLREAEQWEMEAEQKREAHEMSERKAQVAFRFRGGNRKRGLVKADCVYAPPTP